MAPRPALDAGGAYIPVTALARHWGASPRQIYRHIRAGSFAAIRLGPRCVRVRVADVLLFEKTPAWTALVSRAQAGRRAARPAHS